MFLSNRLLTLGGTIWRSLFAPPPQEQGPSEWNEHQVRRKRYEILYGFYDQTIFSGKYAEILKREHGLFADIRPVFNACGQIIDSAVNHIQGGLLDPTCGDGVNRPSCLPFHMGQRALPNVRAGLASIVAASNFQNNKSLVTRWGATLGDVAIEVIPDPKRGLVRLRPIHPSELVRITKDPYGNVKGYTLERWELDPTDPQAQRISLYREDVINDNGTIVYKTSKDGSAFAWPGTPGQEWETAYGFVPLVHIKHIDGGGTFGESELARAVYKTMEIDDQSSNLSDGNRKMVNGPWFLTGAALPPSPLNRPGANPFSGDPFYGPNEYSATLDRRWDGNLRLNVDERDGIPVVTCNSSDARITPMVMPIPVEQASNWIRSIRESLEKDYPELQADRDVSSGNLSSGIAIEKAQSKTKAKYLERRTAYDPKMEAAFKMGLSLGGMLGFPGFEGMGKGAYHEGKLDFHIGNRPVFEQTPSEKALVEATRSTAFTTYISAGFPFRSALQQVGIEDERITAILEDKAQQDATLVATPTPLPPPVVGHGADAGDTAIDTEQTGVVQDDPAKNTPYVPVPISPP